MIQLFKVVRYNCLKNSNLIGPILIGDGELLQLDKKSNVSGHDLRLLPKKVLSHQRYDRKSVSGGSIAAFKNRHTVTAMSKNKEKNNEPLSHHIEEEDGVNLMAHKFYKSYYTHFSPQIWLWTCRVTVFLWAYAYHDFQSWVMLMWIMHSTLFKSTRRFIQVTITYYLPIFAIIFLFYYVINIPRVVEFQQFGKASGDLGLDIWRTFGFYQFSVPALEVGLMLAALFPFFMLIKTRKQLDENSKDDQKSNFLDKLTNEKSPTFYYVLFAVINNLDLFAFITIFFSGVNKIDFYHIFLLFFFVAYILWPESFVRNYIVLLVYVDFFVFEKYLYTLIVHYIPADSWFIPVANVLGLSTDYTDISTQSKFNFLFTYFHC